MLGGIGHVVGQRLSRFLSFKKPLWYPLIPNSKIHRCCRTNPARAAARYLQAASTTSSRCRHACSRRTRGQRRQTPTDATDLRCDTVFISHFSVALAAICRSVTQCGHTERLSDRTWLRAARDVAMARQGKLRQRSTGPRRGPAYHVTVHHKRR